MLLVLLVEGEAVAASGTEADAAAEVLQLSGTGVGGHNNDGVAEVHESAVTIGEATLVKHLQQKVVDVGMSLLNLVEQHDGVGVTAHLLGQLSAFLIAHVARRRADES